MNFNENFRKNVIDDKFKSHKKSVLHHLSKKYIFGKKTWACGVELN